MINLSQKMCHRVLAQDKKLSWIKPFLRQTEMQKKSTNMAILKTDKSYQVYVGAVYLFVLMREAFSKPCS